MLRSKQSKGRTPKRVIRQRAAARYPMPRHIADPKSAMSIAPSQNVKLSTPLMPVSKWAKIPYYDQNNFSTGAVASGGYVFTANGLWDPNITGTGHQPMGFDQIMVFYEHYTVTSSRITVNFFNNDADDSVVVGILLAPDANIETNFSKLNENGLLTKRWLNANSGNGNNKCTLTVRADIAKLNGKNTVIDDDIFRGDATSNPTEQSYFHLFAYNQVTVNPVTVYFEVLLEFTVKFTEPRKVIQS